MNIYVVRFPTGSSSRISMDGPADGATLARRRSCRYLWRGTIADARASEAGGFGSPALMIVMGLTVDGA